MKMDIRAPQYKGKLQAKQGGVAVWRQTLGFGLRQIDHKGDLGLCLIWCPQDAQATRLDQPRYGFRRARHEPAAKGLVPGSACGLNPDLDPVIGHQFGTIGHQLQGER